MNTIKFLKRTYLFCDNKKIRENRYKIVCSTCTACG